MNMTKSKRYVVDMPSDKLRVGQTLPVLSSWGQIELPLDAAHPNMPALVALYVALCSGDWQPVIHCYENGVWLPCAFHISPELAFDQIEQVSLPEPSSVDAPGLSFAVVLDDVAPEALSTEGLDFIFFVGRSQHGALLASFSQHHFDAVGADYRLRSFAALAASSRLAPAGAVSEHSMYSQADADHMAKINTLNVEYYGQKPIHQQFTEQAARTPDAEALRFGDVVLSYRELDERTNQFAHYLSEKGARKGQRVGIFVERSERMVLAMLGVMKTGAAYIPLDPSYPADRIQYIVDDSHVALVISESKLLPIIEGNSIQPILIDSLDEQLQQEKSDALPVEVSAEDDIYLIYTSGSTGKPKGVLVNHRNVSLYMHSQIDALKVDKSTRALTLASMCFDVSSAEIYCALLEGGCVVVASRAEATNPVALAALIKRENIGMMHATPSTWRLLVESGWEGQDLLAITAGEPFPRQLLGPMLERVRELWNFYGPTETTVYATCCQLTDANEFIHIGRPLPNYRVSVRNALGRPVPTGVTGELWIGGPGVTRGYNNREDLNTVQFIEEDGVNFYRTGDAVRLQVDGNLEYFSRLDGQVKVNGYRIELGEVEAVLSTCEDVQRGVVGVHETSDGGKMLAAWCLMKDSKALDIVALKAHMSDKLPAYMVPVAWTELDSVPLNPNGKLDRKALPPIVSGLRDKDAISTKSASASSENSREAAKNIWLQLLSLPDCDPTVSFFEQGGTSMLALQYVERFNAAQGSSHNIVDFFANSNLQAWSDFVENKVHDVAGTQSSASSSKNRSGQDIAIVGMAVHMPGANDLTKFWSNLQNGVESISRFSREELAASIPAHLIDDPSYVRARGIVENFDCFDHTFFGMNPNEAAITDPQQRLFLQTSWHAFEDAGMVPDQIDGLVGVYAGTYYNTYHTNNVMAHNRLMENMGDLQLKVASEKDYVATRVAYKFNLRGPAISVHTACSTSMVAIAQATAALQLGHCDVAVAGAASITSPVLSGEQYQEGGVFSRDGSTRTFSADATGTAFSDGVGAVVLKRVEGAIADGDRIYAVIKAAATNNDGGGKMSFMAPSSVGQSAVVEAALRQSGVPAETVCYLEAHGTATPVGDPIEVEGLKKAFDQFTDKKQFCAIGSIKSNMGHLTAAAGVAGVIKAALSLYHREIVPTLHCKSINPAINFEKTPFYPALERQAWTETDHPRRAGVSSFGVGGTNAHTLLEEFIAADSVVDDSRSHELLLVSAKSEEALNATTEALAQHLREEKPRLRDVAHTLLNGRKHFGWRRFVVASQDDAGLRMSELQAQHSATTQLKEAPEGVAFMYPGQGSQYAGMGSNLYAEEPVYKQAVDRCADLLLPELGMDIRQLLLATGDELPRAQALIDETRYTQPSLFVTAYALGELWQSWGLKPAAVIGHSIGEFAAAHLAGVFSLQDALMLVARRGAMMQALASGSMLSIRCTVDEFHALASNGVTIAAINGAKALVVAGTDGAIAAFTEVCQAQSINCRQLHTSHAFHSPMMDPMVESFAELVGSVSRQAGTVPMMSTADCDWLSNSRVADPNYWTEQLRNPVRFAESVSSLWENKNYLLLELGPRATLSTLAKQQATDRNKQIALASLADTAENQREVQAVLSTLGRLWQAGVSLDWKTIQSPSSRQVISLPGYVFDKHRHWLAAHAVRQEGLVEVAPELQLQASEPIQATVVAEITSPLERLKVALHSLLCESSGLDISDSEFNETFISLGMDSLFLIRVSNSLKKTFGVEVGYRRLLENESTINALSKHLLEEMPESLIPAAPAIPVAQVDQPSAALATAQPVSTSTSQINPAVEMSEDYEELLHQQLALVTQQLQLIQMQLESFRKKRGQSSPKPLDNNLAERSSALPSTAQTMQKPKQGVQASDSSANMDVIAVQPSAFQVRLIEDELGKPQWVSAMPAKVLS